jgi:MFS family permease
VPWPLLPSAVIALGISLWATCSMVSVTVLPSAVREIGGLELLSWATTAYFTASIACSAAGDWAKARLGLRRALGGGALLFMSGSLLCALAPRMPVLLAGRFGQGMGAGLVAALCYGLVRSAFPEALWARGFALITAVWGIAAMAGPALGGVLTELVGWRFAFAALLLPGLLVMLLALLLPAASAPGARPGAPPMLRLLVLAAGIVCIGLAGNLPGWLRPGLAAAAGLVLLAAALRLDRMSRRRLFPRGLISPAAVIGRGMLAKLALLLATMPTGIYGAFLLQDRLGAGPLLAGYVIALEAIAWTAAAFLAGRLPARLCGAAMGIGPLLVGGGIAVSGVAFAHGPIALAALSISTTGFGFGLCWAFLGSRVLAAAPAGEGDRTAGAIPTIETVGVALGAALVGIGGNALGVAQLSAPGVVPPSPLPLFLIFVLFAAAGWPAALALARTPFAPAKPIDLDPGSAAREG